MNSTGHQRHKDRRPRAPTKQPARDNTRPTPATIQPPKPRPLLLVLSILLLSCWLIVLIKLAANALYGVSGAPGLGT